MAPTSRIQALAAALRIHQWTKNLLVFAAPVLGHRLDSLTIFHAFQAFAAISLASSAAYVINDVRDIPHDRLHPRKQFRPFASGALPIGTAWLLVPALLVGAIAIALWSTPALALWIAGYTALTLAYSYGLKRVIALDVVILASLYCARVLAGGLATGIPISPWALAFTMFLFFSIAMLKRYAELHHLRLSDRAAPAGRGYSIEDMPVIAALGAASSMTAVFVIALYVNGDDIRRQYPHFQFLWIICLVVLLWISRLWLLANRGEMNEDPVLFALQDRWSLALAVCVILLLVLASH